MINSKKDYKRYLKRDYIARFGHSPNLLEKLKYRHIIKFHKLLRKTEYLVNCKNNFYLPSKIIYQYRLGKLERKLGWIVPINTFEEGLCIVHEGPVVINGNSQFGKNARLHICVNVGSNKGKDAPKFGNNVYIGPGAKIFGNIYIGSNTAIGANAVVNKTFIEGNITIAGIPAKKVSNKGTEDLIVNIQKEGR